MRKKMGVLTTLLTLSLMTLSTLGFSDNRGMMSRGSWGGQQAYSNQGERPQYNRPDNSGRMQADDVYSRQYQQDGRPAYQQDGRDQSSYRGPQYDDSCCPDVVTCKTLPQCPHPSSNKLNCQDYIIVTASNPQTCLLGDNYPLEFNVHACDDVCEVIVNTTLPEGVSFVSSTPEAKADGKTLTWSFGSMRKGECRTAKVILKCECEGPLCACFCASATPVRFCALLCAKPTLTCHKTGPEQVCPGDDVHYTITVSNTGSCAAKDVVVVDNVPPELEHHSGQKVLQAKIGDLQPCQTKTVSVCLKAVKRGNACNTAVVSACNAESSSCQFCTCVCCCMVDLRKEGPKEVQIGKNADYRITLTNPGDLPLTDVVVTDYAPHTTSIVSARGANVNCNQAVWRLKQLNPGETVTFDLTLTSCTPGCTTNKVTVTNCQGCNDCAEFTTRWRGRPAINACVVDSANPLCIGEYVVYTVTVQNEGSEPDANVGVVLNFPSGVQPKGVDGPSKGSISGQSVSFEPYKAIGPRQTLTYRVEAQAVSSGDGRIVTEIKSDSLKTPISQQTNTIVN